MKESMGLVPTLSVIIFALVLISGYLAFTINYSKAYKANSKIVNIIQKYNNKIDERAQKEINEYLESINYTSSENYLSKCSESGYEIIQNTTGKGWCYKIISSEDKTDKSKNDVNRVYVKVRTYISIDIPILNRIFPNLELSRVDGATKPVIVE